MANCSEARGTITMDRGFYENYKDEIENAWNGYSFYSFYGISWDDVDFKENTVIINFYGTGRWSMASTLEWWFFNEWSPSFADVIQREKPVLMVDYTDMETGMCFYYHALTRIDVANKKVIEYQYDDYEYGTREMWEFFGYDYDELMEELGN